jgi:hypothetical protein
VSGPRLRNSLTKAKQGTGKALARVRPKVKEFLNQGKALARVWKYVQIPIRMVWKYTEIQRNSLIYAHIGRVRKYAETGRLWKYVQISICRVRKYAETYRV